MAVEQPDVSSAEPQADVSASQPSSAEPEQQTSKSPSWWQNLFHRGGPEPADSSADSRDERPSTIQLTQEELDRRVQAETDRRESKRMQDARVRQRRELRDSDPWAYAQQEREAEQVADGQGQLHQFVVNIGAEHDRVSIDPLFLALPKTEQERIQKLDGAGSGLAGRKLVVDEALK